MGVETQRLLTHMFGSASPSDDGEVVKFVDLFCGFGGASTGAVDAGLQVVFAADCWDVALKSHLLNHPNCQHRLLTFPCPDDEMAFPDTAYHLHGSPPCTRLSPMHMKTDENEINDAIALVRWFLALALRKSPRRWSMEQVANPRVIDLLTTLRRTNRAVDYVVIDFADLQLPQHRRRLIAGPPWLVDNLRAFQSSARRVPVGRVLPTMPPHAKYIRNSLVNYTTGPLSGTRMPKRKSMRRVTRPSFTVVASISLRWYDRNMKCIRNMTPDELKKVQGYPDWYVFPEDVPTRTRVRGVGNSVPPSVIALALGKRPPTAPLPRAGERGACDLGEETDNDADDPDLHKEINMERIAPIDLAEGLRRGSPSLQQ